MKNLATGSGKTSYLLKLLTFAPELFRDAPTNLIILYSVYQSIYEKFTKLSHFKSVKLIKGLDLDFEDIRDCILCVDDQQQELMQDKNMQNVFTKLSHH